MNPARSGRTSSGQSRRVTAHAATSLQVPDGKFAFQEEGGNLALTGFYKWLRVWKFLNAYEDKTSSKSLLESQAASACSEEILPAVRRFGRAGEKNC